MKKFSLLLLFLLLFAGCKSEESTDSSKERDIKTESVFRPVTSFNDPGAIAGDGDILFLAERNGRIWQLEGGEKKLWANLSSRTGPGGLRGIALSPNWETDRLFYVFLENRGQAQVLLEGADEGSGGAIRREVLRLPDKSLDPGPIAFLGEDLLVAVGGKPKKSSWAGSLLRIRPFIGNGQAYSVPRGSEEVWISGFESILSLAPIRKTLFISEEDKLLRLDLSRKVVSAKKIPPIAEAPCLRGGAADNGKFLYIASCQGEVLALPGKRAVASIPSPQLLQASGGDVWGVGGEKLYRLEER